MCRSWYHRNLNLFNNSVLPNFQGVPRPHLGTKYQVEIHFYIKESVIFRRRDSRRFKVPRLHMSIKSGRKWIYSPISRVPRFQRVLLAGITSRLLGTQVLGLRIPYSRHEYPVYHGFKQQFMLSKVWLRHFVEDVANMQRLQHILILGIH